MKANLLEAFCGKNLAQVLKFGGLVMMAFGVYVGIQPQDMPMMPS